MNNEITFDGLTTCGACTAPVALATMTPAAAAVGVLVVAKLANKLVVAKIVGVTPT
ncbi:MAG: hypothetical protein NXH87_08465 [Rhodobiaceae bacterium]|nr:hypothetical protein RHODOSMS8_01841 [Rhodobiaceae bacterium]MCR9241398.1 hypothetical protein [Rhodobiaceae bacterium]